eukprot:scaffold2334_cov160-Ochromonas_danica.AAC.2
MIRGGFRARRRALSSMASVFPPMQLARRSTQKIFLGRYFREEDNNVFSEQESKILESSRKRTEQAIINCDEDEFISTAFDFMKELEDLPQNCVLYLNKQLMFHGPSSHVHEAYRNIFRKAFQKAMYAEGHPSAIHSNHSGFFFIGPRGVGKSALLQTTTLVTGQLLPKFISMYADSDTLSDTGDIRKLLIYMINSFFPDKIIPEDTHINVVLAIVEASRISLGIFLDEAQERYKNQYDWKYLHSCITSYNAAVFLSGSSSFLAPRVKLTTEDREYLCSINDDKDRPSLNTTKLTQESIVGFQRPRQYIDYFATRMQHFRIIYLDWIASADLANHSNVAIQEYVMRLWKNEGLRDDELVHRKSLMLDVSRIHSVCGGRIRTLEAWRHTKDASVLVEFNPSAITEEMTELLKPFFAQIEHFGKFDPFNLPVLQISRAHAKIGGGFQGNVNEFVRNKLLTYIGSDSVTLYSPAVYLLLAKCIPSVFISHSEAGDTKQLLATVEYLRSAAIVVCSSDPDSRAYMSQVVSNIENWETEQVNKQGRNKIVVLLSKSYCKKVDDASQDTGSKREWSLIQKRLAANPHDPSVILTYVSPFAENVTGSVKDFVQKRSLLKFGEHNNASLLARIIEL